MLNLILILSFIFPPALAATSARKRAIDKLRAGCLRSEIHAQADQRREICDCIVLRMNANKKISDADLEYLAKTWESPKQKIENEPKEADILADYDEDVTNYCIERSKSKD